LKPAQELFLELIECAGRWNSFDGPAIAAALRANQSLWRAVVLTDCGGDTRFNDEGEVCGINPHLGVLAGLLEGHVQYDVIRAIPTAGNAAALEQLFNTFHADSLRWLPLEDCSSAFGRTARGQFASAGYVPEKAVLEAWWD
jgi:hypothetical protein